MNTHPTILCNDTHTSIYDHFVQQGGPARFSDLFRKHLFSSTKYNLVSFLCTDNTKDKNIFTRNEKFSSNHAVYELVYPRGNLQDLYTKNNTLKELKAISKSYITPIEEILRETKPQLVFLNGFGLTNWFLMKAAHSLGIPVVIQHAGISKKEVFTSRSAFSSSFRSFMYQTERDTIKLCAHHIFLNEFSRDVFCDIYNINSNSLTHSIIPLPIDNLYAKEIKIIPQKKNINIGVVARWDKIKNHSAIMRLAESTSKPVDWTIHVVTRMPDMSKTKFGQKYSKLVQIHTPMPPEKLSVFYEKMDICLLPSRFDVSPTVVTESFLSGRPIIVSDQTGWTSVLKKFGLENHIVPVNVSGKRLVQKITTIISTSEKHQSQYKKLQSYLIKSHNPVMVFKHYFTIFKSLM